MAKFKTLVPVVLMVALLLAACSTAPTTPDSDVSTEPGPATAPGNRTVTIPLIGDPTPWPVNPPGLISDIMVGKTLFNTLVRYSDEDGVTPVPDLAVSWEPSEDATVWTFNLREDVKWHDGTPFTADDVVFTFQAIMNPDVASRWRSALPTLDNVEALGNHTVRFTFRAPFSPLLTTLAYNLSIVPKHLLEGQDLKSPQAFIDNPVGTGPFKYQSHVSGSHFVVQANPDYYEGRPEIDQVVFKVMPDVNAQIAALKSGDMDIVWTVPPMHMAALENEGNIEFTQVSVPQWYWFPVNLNNPIFADKRVRQAMAYGLDRQAIVDQIVGGQGEVASGPLPSVLSWIPRDTFTVYPFDPDKAKQLLAEAGWTPGADGILVNSSGEKFGFTLLADKGDPVREQIYLVAHDQWRKLGMDVDIQYTEWNTILSLYAEGKFDSRLGWWVIKPDPDIYDYFHTDGALNQIRYSNPEVDRLLELGQATVDTAERADIYRQVQEILIDDQPSIFLYYPVEVRATSKRLQGLPPIAYRDALLYLHKARLVD